MANLLPRSILFLFLCASLAAAQEPSQAPLEVPTETQRTYLVKKVAPVYPPLARQARIQGTVILRVVISKSGDVGNIQPISGHPMLAPAAIEAVKQWKYQPYLVDGMPVEVETKVQVNFKLAKNRLRKVSQATLREVCRLEPLGRLPTVGSWCESLSR